jgi:hypothetical protein
MLVTMALIWAAGFQHGPPPTQTCPDGSVILASETCPAAPPPPPATRTCPDGSVILASQACAAMSNGHGSATKSTSLDPIRSFQDKLNYYAKNGLNVYKKEDLDWAVSVQGARGQDNLFIHMTPTETFGIELKYVRSVAGTGIVEVVRKDPRRTNTVGTFFYKIEVDCRANTTRFAVIEKLNADFSTTRQPISPARAKAAFPPVAGMEEKLLLAVCK